jgi:hypothetical protein
MTVISLTATAHRILELSQGRLTNYHGNYDYYLEKSLYRKKHRKSPKSMVEPVFPKRIRQPIGNSRRKNRPDSASRKTNWPNVKKKLISWKQN